MNDLFETIGNITKPTTDFYNFVDKVNEFALLKNAEQLELQHSPEIIEPIYEEYGLNDAQKEMFATYKKAIDKIMIPFKEYIKVFESELNKKYNLSDDQKITLDININGLCHTTYTIDIFKNGKMYIFKYYNKNYKSKKTNMKNISDIVENIVKNNFISRVLVNDVENDLKWRIEY